MANKRVAADKKNVVLDELAVVYCSVHDVKPNSYNPNRQSTHDFELLCKSIAEDGFTQPIVVQKDTMEIIDGEHRWRACKALGFTEIPIVLTSMTPEQMRIATLRHNRARGSEDASMAADVLRELRDLGSLDYAQEALALDDVELQRLIQDISSAEAVDIEMIVPDSLQGPRGRGLSDLDNVSMTDRTADQLRAKEKLLAQAKSQEEKDMVNKDHQTYRVVVFFTGEEAKIVKSVLEPGAAQNVLNACREMVG